MAKYITRRLIWTPIVLLIVSFITFSLGHFGPGDPVQVLMGQKNNPIVVERIRKERGLDKPFLEQYANYVKGVVQGDFGESYRFTGQPVGDLDESRRPPTFCFMRRRHMQYGVCGLFRLWETLEPRRWDLPWFGAEIEGPGSVMLRGVDRRFRVSAQDSLRSRDADAVGELLPEVPVPGSVAGARQHRHPSAGRASVQIPAQLGA